jgi:hypothetical protein
MGGRCQPWTTAFLAVYTVFERASGTAGTYCGNLLANLGANVIKVQRLRRRSRVLGAALIAPRTRTAVRCSCSTTPASELARQRCHPWCNGGGDLVMAGFLHHLEAADLARGWNRYRLVPIRA